MLGVSGIISSESLTIVTSCLTSSAGLGVGSRGGLGIGSSVSISEYVKRSKSAGVFEFILGYPRQDKY